MGVARTVLVLGVGLNFWPLPLGTPLLVGRGMSCDLRVFFCRLLLPPSPVVSLLIGWLLSALMRAPSSFLAPQAACSMALCEVRVWCSEMAACRLALVWSQHIRAAYMTAVTTVDIGELHYFVHVSNVQTYMHLQYTSQLSAKGQRSRSPAHLHLIPPLLLFPAEPLRHGGTGAHPQVGHGNGEAGILLVRSGQLQRYAAVHLLGRVMSS